MSSPLPHHASQPVSPSNSQPLAKPKKRQFTQERVMLMMTGVFVLGMLAYTFLGEPWRGMAVGLISGLAFMVMFI